MHIAVYPGTFDPITNGHNDLVRHAASMFERVVIGIAANPNKTPLFTLDERVDMARRVLEGVENVEVLGYAGLTVDLAHQQGCGVVIRGLRAVSDFEFEFQLANMTRHLSKDIETVFMTPQEQYTFISSTLVREIAVLDILANNTDRKSGHCLLAHDRVWAIDNGLCFSVPFKLRTVIWEFGGEDISEALLDRVAPLVERIPIDIAALLDEDEIAAMQHRATKLVTERVLPDDDSGHRYPWPLV